MLVLVNLDSAFARRASMEAQLKAAGLAAERVGVDLRGVARARAREMASRAFPAFRFGGLLPRCGSPAAPVPALRGHTVSIAPRIPAGLSPSRTCTFGLEFLSVPMRLP